MSYSMSLNDLLSLFSLSCEEQVTIESLVIDSRKASLGCVFFAYPGVSADGRDFIQSAQEAGASAIIYEAAEFQLPDSITVPVFAVHNVQSMLGYVAAEFYRQPSTEMQVFGVTGTNGKTTCCYLLTQALSKLGLEAAMIGTIGIGRLDSLDDSGHTTPDPVAVQKALAGFRDQGVTQVCMEVSSHALDQGRVNGVQFFCTLFTNLSHDHLDYHGDMERYATAKQKLFTDFHSELVVTNADDRLGSRILDVADADFVVRYGVGGDVFADEVVLKPNGIGLLIEGNGVEFEITTPLVGKVNVANIEMLVASLLALSTSVEDIQSILSDLHPAPGRMELYTADNKAQVVVDFAHTPDALEKALLSIKEHCDGELWCVFGCGGDRDKEKRSVMGSVADKYADRIVVTNDNPRSESPSRIVDDISESIKRKPFQVVLDRRKAIAEVISAAASNDWVLVAGKGHETTQEVAGVKKPFSDREVVSELLGGIT